MRTILSLLAIAIGLGASDGGYAARRSAVPPEFTDLYAELAERGLRLTSSRCGDFHAALRLFADDPMLDRMGDDLVTHMFDPSRLDEAFAVARSAACVKAIVTHA